MIKSYDCIESQDYNYIDFGEEDSGINCHYYNYYNKEEAHEFLNNNSTQSNSFKDQQALKKENYKKLSLKRRASIIYELSIVQKDKVYEEKPTKEEIRKQRNRQSAQNSRDRKKHYFSQMEQSLKQALEEIERLKYQNGLLENENKNLKDSLQLQLSTEPRVFTQAHFGKYSLSMLMATMMLLSVICVASVQQSGQSTSLQSLFQEKQYLENNNQQKADLSFLSKVDNLNENCSGINVSASFDDDDDNSNLNYKYENISEIISIKFDLEEIETQVEMLRSDAKSHRNIVQIRDLTSSL